MNSITIQFLFILTILTNLITSQILKSNKIKTCSSNLISSTNSLTLTESLINFDTGKVILLLMLFIEI